jgi:hypothetical protein
MNDHDAQFCGEVYDTAADDFEYTPEAPANLWRGMFNGLIFTLCAGFLFWFAAWAVRGMQ